MKYIKYSAIYLIVFFIETNLIDFISIKGIAPDLSLIFLVFVSLKEPQIVAVIFGFGTGLFQDLFTFSLLGLSSLSKSLSCFLTFYFQQSKGNYSISYLGTVFFVITIIHDRIYQFIFLLGTNHHFFKSFLWYSFPKAIYTTAVAIIINFLLNKTIWQSGEI